MVAVASAGSCAAGWAIIGLVADTVADEQTTRVSDRAAIKTPSLAAIVVTVVAQTDPKRRRETQVNLD
jgi:hypothetical protein